MPDSNTAIIKRLGYSPGLAHQQAMALASLAGKENVQITLRGPWRTTQGGLVLETPCRAGVGWDGSNFAIDEDRTNVSPNGPGAVVDIVARVSRVEGEQQRHIRKHVRGTP